MSRYLLELIKGGGYILYTRHGEASIGLDQLYLDFWNCFTQRNLSKQGKSQAIYYGEVLRQLQIPISFPIIASPFCRTIETAELAFGRSSVQIDPFWFEAYKLSGSIPNTEQRRILEILQSKLEIIPPQGSNRVIVAHSFPSGVGLGKISNMGTVIIRPRGQGYGYEILNKLSLSDFANLQI